MSDQTIQSPEADAPPPEMMPVMQEFLLFVRENKKWWMVPMGLMVFLLGSLLVLSSGYWAPFIYSLL